jgi:hypothetical protein
MKTNCKLNTVIALDGALNPQPDRTVSLPTKSPEASPAFGKKLAIFASYLFATLLIAGCASTKVSDRQQDVTGSIARPAHIWVYNFIANAADMPADSPLAGEDDVDTTATQTAEQIAEGKKLGAQIATELVAQVNAMGMSAFQAAPGTTPQVNDIVLRGYLLSVKEGSGAKRVIIGFGAGGSELRTFVEGFQVTATGQRKLGSGTLDSSGNKTPGAALGVATFLATKNPAGLIISGGMKAYGEASGKDTIEGRAKATAKEISDLLKKRFQEQGWITQ